MKKREREGTRWKVPSKGVFVHLFRFLEQAGSHRTPRGPGNVSIRDSRERKREKKEEEGGQDERRKRERTSSFGEQALKGSSSL